MDELRIILIIIGLALLLVIYWMGRRDERRAMAKTGERQRPDTSSVLNKPPWLQDSGGTNGAEAHADYDDFTVGVEVQDDFEDEFEDKVFIPAPSKQPHQPQTGASSGSVFHSNSATNSTNTGRSGAMLVNSDESLVQTLTLSEGLEPLLVNLTVMAPKDMSFDAYFLKQTLEESGLAYGDMNIYHYYRKPKMELEPNRGQRLFSVASIIEPGYFDNGNMETYRTPGIILFLQLPGPIDGVLAFEKMHQLGDMLAKQLHGTLCDDKRNKITPQAVTHIKDRISEYNLKLRIKAGRTVH